jgi:hypothetical protein
MPQGPSIYHSSDYNHNWSISIPELVRTSELFNAIYSGTGLRSGCYKTDPTSIDGFAVDTLRDPALPVVLEYYHSADYDRDGNIDEAELDRVTYLYNSSQNSIRNGNYHISPDTIDGFEIGADMVGLSSYQFDSAHPPTIFTTNTMVAIQPQCWYKLRCKFLDGSSTGLMGTEDINNNNLSLTVLPPPGKYNVELYWIKYSYGGFEGDYDNDGYVTQADVDAILNVAVYVLPQPTGSQYMRSDCAPISTLGDGGEIDVSDAAMAAQYARARYQLMPVGGPGTPDVNPALITSIGATTFAVVTISPAAIDDDPSTCSKCEDLCDSTVLPVLEDQGQCSSPPVQKTCNTADLPETACANEIYVTEYDPSSTPRFTVVAYLKTQDCVNITTESDQPISISIQ